MNPQTTPYSIGGKVLYILLLPLFIIVPSTRTRGVVFDESGKVLLVRNWIGSNAWDFPGGGLHRAESAEAGVSRELYEETGIQIGEEEWHYIAQYNKRSTKFVYLTASSQLKELQLQKREIAEAAWFSLDALPSKRNVFIDRVLAAATSR